MTQQYTDHITEASKQQQNRSPFVCTSCKRQYGREEASKQKMTCCGRTLTELFQESFGP